jgi:hypothetical protein
VQYLARQFCTEKRPRPKPFSARVGVSLVRATPRLGSPAREREICLFERPGLRSLLYCSHHLQLHALLVLHFLFIHLSVLFGCHCRNSRQPQTAAPPRDTQYDHARGRPETNLLTDFKKFIYSVSCMYIKELPKPPLGQSPSFSTRPSPQSDFRSCPSKISPRAP